MNGQGPYPRPYWSFLVELRIGADHATREKKRGEEEKKKRRKAKRKREERREL